MNKKYLRTNSEFFLPSFLNFTRIKDLKRLNRYLINIHQAVNFEEITLELSKCISDIFVHEFFGLAVQDKDKLMVWIEPSVFKARIESIVRKDFSFDGDLEIHSINSSKTGFLEENSLEKSLLGKEFYGTNFKAKLYILPGKKIIGKYHGEIISDMVTGLENAVSSFIKMKSLEDAASIDFLTGCYNRREFNLKLEGQFSFCRRYEKDFSLVMFDIDYFKKINDTYGHDSGDQILKEISGRIKKMIRTEDSLFRYGGEEFAVILPGTEESKAAVLADRLREEIAAQPFIIDNHPVFVTSSFGVSSFARAKTSEELVKNTDKLLYRAKNSGRNKVMPKVLRLYKQVAK
ncbi:MAG: GGDEF domain-containing protein [Desulforegulaceae bacterium]|nr:GGDEF domain-containing protein [Desulforegulaceae bacterium]